MGGGGGFVGEWALRRLLPCLFGDVVAGPGRAECRKNRYRKGKPCWREGRALVIAAQALIGQGRAER